MAGTETPAGRRYEQAGDRDIAADHRDDRASRRDDAANQREVDATDRDNHDSRHAHDAADQHWQLRKLILDHFDRLANTALDPTAWPDLTPAASERLHELVADQERLAAHDRTAIVILLDQLDTALHGHRVSRLAAKRDRQAAGDDRRHSAHDRAASVIDRDLSARDRAQAAIENEQLTPTETARIDDDRAK